MEKQPVGQLPDLTQSNNDDEIMVITNDEYNQLKKETISNLLTDFTSTNENNALTKGTDGKLFVTDFGNASNITEGTLPVDVLPESGVTADTYAYPSSVTVNAQGQVTAIEEGTPSGANANTDLSNITEAGKEVIRENSRQGLPIGAIIPFVCSQNWTPENCLPCDGTEYTQAQFPTLYTNWLVAGHLNTCTYEEYQTEITTYGKCAKWGLDTTNSKFKTPTIPDGTIIQQAMTDDKLGKSYNAGLPNIEGEMFNRAFSGGGNGIYGFADAFSHQDVSTAASVAYSAQQNSTKSRKISFNASASNPIYGNSDTVQPEAIALRHFVVVATGAINQSEMDWSEWASSLAGKANINADNFSAIGKAEITSWGIPNHNATTTLTLPSIGQIYTVPYDCYMYFCDAGSAGGGDVVLRLNSSSGAIVVQVGTANNDSFSVQGVTFAKGTKLYVQSDKNITIKTICPLIGAEI